MLTNKVKAPEAFEKIYKVQVGDVRLPNESSMFSSEPWSDPAFMDIKSSLNVQKGRLSEYDVAEWQNHTYHTNPGKAISRAIKTQIQPEFFTIAWSKFYECACSFKIIPDTAIRAEKIISLHLCEAPGAFIASFNHFLKLNYPHFEWEWRASTLNPYYEGNPASLMITDDRFIKHTLHNWNFGLDNTGNIMDWENSQYIIEEMKKIGDVSIITADGSVDCSLNPEEQETVVASLHFCEVITALQVLSKGGTFIIKIFTLYEHFSINLIYLLLNCFEDLSFFKPATSKPGNSEIYVICIGFHGFADFESYIKKFQLYYGSKDFSTKSMFSKDDLPKAFIKCLYEASIFFYNFQFDTIEENIKLYESGLHRHYRKIKSFQEYMKEIFLSKYKLEKINDNKKICSSLCYENANQAFGATFPVKYGTFHERINYENNLWEAKRKQIIEELKLIDHHFEFIKIDCSVLKKANLSFTYGKPIERLNSSKFVNSHILKLYNELDYHESHHIIFSSLHKITYSAGCCVVEFGKYSTNNFYDRWQKTFVNIIIKVIHQLDVGQNLIFKNFSILLTQFGAGILYILAAVGFSNLIFENDYSIHLVQMKDKQGLISVLNDIKEKIDFESLADIHVNNNRIIGVIPLSILLTNKFSINIYKFNTSKLHEYLIKQL